MVGAASTPGAGSISADEARLAAAMSAAAIQESLRSEIHAAFLAAGTIPVPAAKDADSIIETALTAAGVGRPEWLDPGSGGLGIDPPLLLYLHADVRVARTRDNATLSTARYVYFGRRLRLSEWTAEHAAPLLHGLQAGFASLARQIHDGVFHLYPFPARDAAWGLTTPPAFGLAPLSPVTRGALSTDRIAGPTLSWTAVESLQPTLRWEAFPREADVGARAEEMARVKNVRYELVIAREQNFAPAEVVYRRSGLAEPVHTLESALLPGRRYFWTVRASFELDGRRRVTPWGTVQHAAPEQLTAPSHFSYRFRTPRSR